MSRERKLNVRAMGSGIYRGCSSPRVPICLVTSPQFGVGAGASYASLRYPKLTGMPKKAKPARNNVAEDATALETQPTY